MDKQPIWSQVSRAGEKIRNSVNQSRNLSVQITQKQNLFRVFDHF